jgi:hypothetical protein
MIRTFRQPGELSHEQTLLRGISAAVRWIPIFDRTATRRLDQSFQELTLKLRDPNMRNMNEKVDFYEDIENGCNLWDESSPPQFIDYDSALAQSQTRKEP